LFGKLVHGGEVKSDQGQCLRLRDHLRPAQAPKGRKKAGPRLEKDEESEAPETPEAQPEA
jgi:hypothetical protein